MKQSWYSRLQDQSCQFTNANSGENIEMLILWTVGLVFKKSRKKLILQIHAHCLNTSGMPVEK
jgi:hypothetical protein